MSNDGTVLGNVSGGGGVLEKTFSTTFSNDVKNDFRLTVIFEMQRVIL